MIEKTISRRELFGSFSSAEKSADKGISVVEGNIVIPNKPLQNNKRIKIIISNTVLLS